MHRLTFFPLGNADCCRIELANGRVALFDFANTRIAGDDEDKRCDLANEIRDGLVAAGRDAVDVLAITHLDRDHYCGSSEFFFLEHAEKYQSEERIKIRCLWVPAAVLIEELPDDPACEEARVLQREARYRFKKGTGVRVFSRPERLVQWCTDNGIKIDDRRDIISDAGTCAQEFTLAADEVEFFVHSPHAVRQDDCTVVDRNGHELVMQATFVVDGIATKALLLGDACHEDLAEVVAVTRKKKHDERLDWDIAKLPHHCSYLSLGPEKGEDETTPVDEVGWLYREGGQPGAIMVSSSKPMPVKGSAEDEDQNPPHREAAATYKSIVDDLGGQFVVTMEHPSEDEPRPVVVEIHRNKATLKKIALTAFNIASSQPAPRAG